MKQKVPWAVCRQEWLCVFSTPPVLSFLLEAASAVPIIRRLFFVCALVSSEVCSQILLSGKQIPDIWNFKYVQFVYIHRNILNKILFIFFLNFTVEVWCFQWKVNEADSSSSVQKKNAQAVQGCAKMQIYTN